LILWKRCDTNKEHLNILETTMPNNIAIRAVDIHRRFVTINETLEILRSVNLSIQAGEMVAIVGQSGSGKSTLLHILGALDRPSSGSVYFGDRDIFSLDNGELAEFRRHSIGFVFQFHNLLPEFTALENVLMPRLIAGELPDEKVGEELLETVGLGSRKRHRPGELSGGEQQRVAIARALVNQPQLVLADEPTGSLDTVTADRVFELFRKIQQRKNLTSILATHNVKIASRCDRVLKLDDGNLEEVARPYV
jgi:lipoprotein-releasing system ATP-binding protein